MKIKKEWGKNCIPDKEEIIQKIYILKKDIAVITSILICIQKSFSLSITAFRLIGREFQTLGWNLQPWPLAYKRLLNKPYENEVFSRGQNLPYN